MQKGAGLESGFDDADYKGVTLVDSEEELLGQADVVLKVQPPTEKEVGMMREGTVVLGYMAPHEGDSRIKELCKRQITSLSMELVPRISRAQSIDALSSQGAISGYKAVLIAAERSPRFFPMLTTAAGTIRPSKVLVIGAGVAGLQAIATARRLGAQVSAYDVRSATAEQVESLGAKFVDTGVKAEGEGGYARELTAEEKKKQAEVLADYIAASHAVITTAAIPAVRRPRSSTRPRWSVWGAVRSLSTWRPRPVAIASSPRPARRWTTTGCSSLAPRTCPARWPSTLARCTRATSATC